jgi:hypothetical protein
VRWVREHLPRETRIQVGRMSAWYEADVIAYLEQGARPAAAGDRVSHAAISWRSRSRSRADRGHSSGRALGKTPEIETAGEWRRGRTALQPRSSHQSKGVGRIRSSSGTSDLEEFKVRDAILTKLKRNAQLRVLLAFKDGELSIEQLVEADAGGKLKIRPLLAEIALRAPLWKSIDAALPDMGKGDKTRRRYFTSLKKLRAKASKRIRLPVRATVADLRRARWQLLEREWGGSPADWNHLRRAISAFLTVHLDNVHHPFRLRVLKKIPIRGEKSRVPDLPVETFWQDHGSDAGARTTVLRHARRDRHAPGRVPRLHPAAPRAREARDRRPRHEDGRERRADLRRRRALAMDRARDPVAAPRELDAHLLAARLPRRRRGGAVGTGRIKTMRVKRTTSGPYRTGEAPVPRGRGRALQGANAARSPAPVRAARRRGGRNGHPGDGRAPPLESRADAGVQASAGSR